MKNEEAAKDVIQDSYLKAFTKLDTLENPEAFAGWLEIIVANTAGNALQKQNPLLFTDIAEALNCFENTVKSRLNYGRKAIKVKSEELQKKGCTLYNIMPISLLIYLYGLEKNYLTSEGAFDAVGSLAAKNIIQAVAVSQTGVSARTGTAAKAGEKVVESAAKNGFLHTMPGKLTVAMIGVCVAAAGGAALVNSFSDEELWKYTERFAGVNDIRTGNYSYDITTSTHLISVEDINRVLEVINYFRYVEGNSSYTVQDGTIRLPSQGISWRVTIESVNYTAEEMRITFIWYR